MIDFKEWCKVSALIRPSILDWDNDIVIPGGDRPEYWLDIMGLYETSYMCHHSKRSS